MFSKTNAVVLCLYLACRFSLVVAMYDKDALIKLFKADTDHKCTSFLLSWFAFYFLFSSMLLCKILCEATTHVSCLCHTFLCLELVSPFQNKLLLYDSIIHSQTTIFKFRFLSAAYAVRHHILFFYSHKKKNASKFASAICLWARQLHHNNPQACEVNNMQP